MAVAHRPCKSQADVCEGAGEPTHLEDCAFKTVFLNDELLVVDKPHYVRLQGDFAVTVLKLVGGCEGEFSCSALAHPVIHKCVLSTLCVLLSASLL